MVSVLEHEGRTSPPLLQARRRSRSALCLGSTLASIRLRSLHDFSIFVSIFRVTIF